jgi:hypothetical protein
LAGKIKEMTDITQSCVFVLHHITKDSSKRFNLDEGYRPRKEYIKGSTRILDYVQQALLVNLPRKYKDLLIEEQDKADLFRSKSTDTRFNKKRFRDEFWSMNPKGDSFTKEIHELEEMSWNELKFHVSAESTHDDQPLTVNYIMDKYREYCFQINDLNRRREKQYHSQKLSIYTFIRTKKYKEDFSPPPDGRTNYLYGGNFQLCENISSLFLAECVKNRDGREEDNNILRYIVNLDYNHFNPITDGATKGILF